jgi:hypothetical protein
MEGWISRVLDVEGKTVDWRATFILAVMRSASAGLAWAIFSVLMGSPQNFPTLLIFGTAIGILIMIPLALFVLDISKSLPPAGLLGIIPMVYMAGGDPILLLVERYRPGTIPLDDFKPLNFKALLIVLHNDVAQNPNVEALPTAPNVGTEVVEEVHNPGAELREAVTAEPVENEADGATNREGKSEWELFDEASAEFMRLASTGGDAEEKRRLLIKIGDLCDARCKIPGPYVFTAKAFANIDAIEKFDVIIGNLENGHSACSGNRKHQEEIENHFFEVGKRCWDLDRQDLAFRAYMAGLNRWADAGNAISQSSPLSQRLAFMASRALATKAMELESSSETSEEFDEFYDFCETSGVDPTLDIGVSFETLTEEAPEGAASTYHRAVENLEATTPVLESDKIKGEHVGRYRKAIKLFRSDDHRTRAEGIKEFSKLCEEGTQIPLVYYRLALINYKANPVEEVFSVLKCLEGYCDGSQGQSKSSHRPALRRACSMAMEIGEILANTDHREASFVYIYALRWWIQEGNEFPQDAEERELNAFKVARHLAVLDANEGREDRLEYFEEFCKEFGIDSGIEREEVLEGRDLELVERCERALRDYESDDAELKLAALQEVLRLCDEGVKHPMAYRFCAGVYAEYVEVKPQDWRLMVQALVRWLELTDYSDEALDEAYHLCMKAAITLDEADEHHGAAMCDIQAIRFWAGLGGSFPADAPEHIMHVFKRAVQLTVDEHGNANEIPLDYLRDTCDELKFDLSSYIQVEYGVTLTVH